MRFARSARLAILASALALGGNAGCLTGDAYPREGGDGGASPAASQASGVCSRPSARAVQATFRNRTAVSLQLVWVNFECQEANYALLPPGGTVVQPSYSDHVWRLRDASTLTLYKEVVLSPEAAATVEVP